MCNSLAPSDGPAQQAIHHATSPLHSSLNTLQLRYASGDKKSQEVFSAERHELLMLHVPRVASHVRVWLPSQRDAEPL